MYAPLENAQALDVKNLCSRKLYELLSRHALSQQQRQRVEQELIARRHYLNEMGRLCRQGIISA